MRAFAVFTTFSLALLSGCAGGGGGSSSNQSFVSPPKPQAVSITVAPSSATVKAGFSTQFVAQVTGTSNKAVRWSVNGMAGGSANSVGTISSSGLYTAPSPVQSNSNFTITADSAAAPAKSATATVTVVPIPNQLAQTLPVKLGTSGGNVNDQNRSGNFIFCCSGTLGALIQGHDGTQYVLSANHVLARSGQASPGENISQPGLVDSECDSRGDEIVATLTQGAPLKTSNVDAAIAAVGSSPQAVDPSGTIIALGSSGADGPPAATTENASINMSVAKSGRTTGLSCGSVRSIATDVRVDYSNSCSSTATAFTVTFTNQLIIGGGSFSAGGDSGSLIVDASTAQPVGLLFAGSDNSSPGANDGSTAANPIGDVLQAFKDANGDAPTFVGGSTHTIDCSSSSSPSSAAPQSLPISESEIARATFAKSHLPPEIANHPAITGIGIGSSLDDPGRAALLIYVDPRQAAPQIAPVYAGVRTRIISAGFFRPLSSPQSGARSASQQFVLNDDQFASLRAAKQQFAPSLMSNAAVIGVGVGASADNPFEPALVVYVNRNATHGPIPAVFNGFRTRIIASAPFKAFGWNERVHRSCKPSAPPLMLRSSLHF